MLFQLIDDVEAEEDRPGFVCPVGLCSWNYLSTDRTQPGPPGGTLGLAEPPSPPRGKSTRAWHVRSAAGAAGSDLHLEMHAPGFPHTVYPDLSAYAGIAFWARSDSPGQEITLAVVDDKVVASSYDEALRSDKPWFTRRVPLGASWRRHIVLFDDLRQPEGAGVMPDARLHTGALWSFHFLAGLDRTGADLWIDDLALLCRGACPPPAYDLPPSPTAEPSDDSGLIWSSPSSEDSRIACGELASLSNDHLDQLPTGADAKVFLRVRVKGKPGASVPLWLWSVVKLPGEVEVPLTTLDDATSIVAFSLPERGSYRIRAHTHHPGQAVCGVEMTAQVP